MMKHSDDDDRRVPVRCAGPCRKEFKTTVGELRTIVADNRVPVCPSCADRPAATPDRRRGEKADAILLAMFDLGRDQGHHLHDIVVAAWSLNRAGFGLGRYADTYPDAKNVELAVRGQLERRNVEPAGVLHYRLTAAGRVRAAALDAERRQQAGRKAVAK